MPIPSWPAALLPSSYQLHPAANTQSGGRSPFDGSEQTLEQPGMKWVAKLTFDNLTLAEGRLMAAWLAGLRGRAGRFYWGPPAWGPRGTAGTDGGAVVLNGAGQTGTLVAFRGWPASRTQVLYPGDYVTWLDPAGRPQLHIVTSDANGDMVPVQTSAGGQNQCNVSPPIRRSPNNGAGTNFTSPFGLFRLSRDVNPQDFTAGMMASATIEIEEALF